MIPLEDCILIVKILTQLLCKVPLGMFAAQPGIRREVIWRSQYFGGRDVEEGYTTSRKNLSCRKCNHTYCHYQNQQRNSFTWTSTYVNLLQRTTTVICCHCFTWIICSNYRFRPCETRDQWFHITVCVVWCIKICIVNAYGKQDGA